MAVAKYDNIPDQWRRKADAKVLQYGTAGFREKVEDLSHVMFRMGLLAAIRAVELHKAVGVMITASHNPESDNGVKIIDPMGNMLVLSYEKLATELINQTDENLQDFVENSVKVKRLVFSKDGEASVLCAYDTRTSSPAFQAAAKYGVQFMGVPFEDYGILTTPQLHYIVRCTNDPAYGVPTEQGYFEKLSSAFRSLNEGVIADRYIPKLVVDAANGVGGLKLQMLQTFIPPTLLDFTIVNCGEGRLNYECGADFVKIRQEPPKSSTTPKPGERWASFDGDADRIIYFYMDEARRFKMLDGDKICVLLAAYLKELLEDAGIEDRPGVVQTAYANGRSTSYAQKTLKLSVSCVSTGVKNLHHEAEKLPIGVYFEANGHGTVLFSPQFSEAISKRKSDRSLTESNRKALEKLEIMKNLVNEIKDRWSVETTDAERRVVKPDCLQKEIDQLVAQFGPEARSFVRFIQVVVVIAESTGKIPHDKKGHRGLYSVLLVVTQGHDDTTRAYYVTWILPIPLSPLVNSVVLARMQPFM